MKFIIFLAIANAILFGGNAFVYYDVWWFHQYADACTATNDPEQLCIDYTKRRAWFALQALLLAPIFAVISLAITSIMNEERF